jgi:hypothetical protein
MPAYPVVLSMTVLVRVTILVTFAFVMSTLTVARPEVPFSIVTNAVVAWVVIVPFALIILCINGLIDWTV